ncbi:hypothetical protein BJ138DRAFT_1104545 [Hygrophoropsis aurantiaca]|uniref:Uncharacterized protein n=1 Tax=Hygrophoropsis aurantiaca TaxID=72124 RepID=A0ACB8A131_9AGAM|nr:hypothetical protein BJ138DRAFT_1104545 [Hygrophoropsis aurantiaca]
MTAKERFEEGTEGVLMAESDKRECLASVSFALPTGVGLDIAKIPDQLSLDEATILPLGIAMATVPLYLPALDGLAYESPWEDRGRARKYTDHPVLILGGSSTVGQYVIQFAKASGFSPIIATSSPSNFDLLTSLGATHTIDRHLPFSSSSSSIVSEISRITSKPITFVYDAISLPDTQQGGYDLLASGGCDGLEDQEERGRQEEDHPRRQQLPRRGK